MEGTEQLANVDYLEKLHRLEKSHNEMSYVYHLVDQEFINKFPEPQRAFMLMVYYSLYCDYCNKLGIKKLSMEVFIKNARRRKIKIIQICCPYCGNIDMVIWNKPYSDLSNLNYCTKCGKHSTIENVLDQFSVFVRMQAVYKTGCDVLSTKYDESDMKALSYDVLHMGLVELTCILEVMLRDFYKDMVSLKYKSFKSVYLNKAIEENTKNDFMNIEKACKHYKRDLDINLKDLVSTNCWDNLIDMVQIRNTVIHNNGMIDERFKNSDSYKRLKANGYINGNLIFVNEDMLLEYRNNIFEMFSKLELIFDDICDTEVPSMIANYYFNASI